MDYSRESQTVTYAGITVSTKRETLISGTTIEVNLQRKQAKAEKAAANKAAKKYNPNQLELNFI